MDAALNLHPDNLRHGAGALAPLGRRGFHATALRMTDGAGPGGAGASLGALGRGGDFF